MKVLKALANLKKGVRGVGIKSGNLQILKIIVRQALALKKINTIIVMLDIVK